MEDFTMKKFLALLLTMLMVLSLVACRQADRVAYNVSREADSFNVTRKLTVVNVLSDSVLMELSGTFAIAKIYKKVGMFI